ncbi:hypothetical protein E2C01_041792 [Portunus trituberculatus]|uniref:Uncharacterized protein n=1 Tax=Portunus trituberculatus TaxID=210409 RepID=A0A5B7FRM5_PORTR|nr:hypothetical protein [Portunus trituberculatus]
MAASGLRAGQQVTVKQRHRSPPTLLLLRHRDEETLTLEGMAPDEHVYSELERAFLFPGSREARLPRGWRHHAPEVCVTGGRRGGGAAPEQQQWCYCRDASLCSVFPRPEGPRAS